ncbi:MAG: hypothetical protein WCW52_01790 [Elusimicrobiales bacterium]|jgi:hypothetical protein
MITCFRIFAAAAALGLLASCAGRTARTAAKSGVETIETSGLVPYNDRDLAASPGAAVIEAQRNAVEAVADLFMGPQYKAEKYEAFKQGLLKEPGQLVKKYKVLSERREGAFYRANLRVYVFVDKVAAAMRGLELSAGTGAGASGALMLDEYFRTAVSQYADAGRAFSDYLGAKSAVRFLDTPALKNSKDENSFFEAARASGADLVFIGRAEADPMGAAQGPQAGFYPARATAELKIYEAGTRRLLLEISSQSNALDPAEEGAFRKALASAGELLGAEAFSKADKFIRPATPLTLRVRGLEGIEDARKLKAAVESLEVNGSSLESYADGEAVMTVFPARPDAQEFSSALLRTGVFNLELESVSQFEIVFSVIR